MNILKTILEQKKREVEQLPDLPVDADRLRQAVEACGPRRDFLGALRSVDEGQVALIAEVKKASPSAGVICPDFDPVRIARAYEESGARCLSVLTDENFFQGSLDDLRQIRAAVELPLLRKDFIIDARQILEAVEAGADAILLIAAILDDAQLKEYQALAEAAGLAALVEVHDERELGRAWVSRARLIGVNNRNLDTFEVDLGTTRRMAEILLREPGAEDVLLVAESGIHTADHVRDLASWGARAILVGEALMRGDGDMKGKIARLLGQA
jgi:indole-3-glycerol phosphate synthase